MGDEARLKTEQWNKKTVHTIKQLPNLEQLDVIGTETLEEIQKQNSRGHVSGYEGRRQSG